MRQSECVRPFSEFGSSSTSGGLRRSQCLKGLFASDAKYLNWMCPGGTSRRWSRYKPWLKRFEPLDCRQRNSNSIRKYYIYISYISDNCMVTAVCNKTNLQSPACLQISSKKRSLGNKKKSVVKPYSDTFPLLSTSKSFQVPNLSSEKRFIWLGWSRYVLYISLCT